MPDALRLSLSHSACIGVALPQMQAERVKLDVNCASFVIFQYEYHHQKQVGKVLFSLPVFGVAPLRM